MYYIALKEDWSDRDIFNSRKHYLFDNKKDAVDWLIKKKFYYDKRRKEYILEHGYSVAFARIIELVTFK